LCGSSAAVKGSSGGVDANSRARSACLQRLPALSAPPRVPRVVAHAGAGPAVSGTLVVGRSWCSGGCLGAPDALLTCHAKVVILWTRLDGRQVRRSGSAHWQRRRTLVAAGHDADGACGCRIWDSLVLLGRASHVAKHYSMRHTVGSTATCVQRAQFCFGVVLRLHAVRGRVPCWSGSGVRCGCVPWCSGSLL
jgi:hypothetical protein